MFVQETNDAVLSCNVRANPPVTVVWKKDGEVLDMTTGSYKSTNNGITAQLSIPKVKRDVHQGLYVCETKSAVYGVTGRTFQVTVEGLWSCFILNFLFSVLKKSMFNFKISVHFFPPLDRVIGFPLGPLIAGVVVVACTIVLALISRRNKIIKVCLFHSG